VKKYGDARGPHSGAAGPIFIFGWVDENHTQGLLLLVTLKVWRRGEEDQEEEERILIEDLERHARLEARCRVEPARGVWWWC